MKNNSHTDHQVEIKEKSQKSSEKSGKKPHKTEKAEPRKTVKETIEILHAAIAKETESSMENLILVSIVFFII